MAVVMIAAVVDDCDEDEHDGPTSVRLSTE